MIIAYVCDEKYLPLLKVSMASVKRYNKNVEFAILTDKPFEVEGAKVYTFAPDTERFKFRTKDRMGAGVYYKLYLPKLPYDKVLYIDCDILCQRPLKSLWEQDCPFICGTESHTYGKFQAQELGLQKYCLTSMMLMNLKALRQANFTEVCLNKLAEINPKFHDETIINVCFNDKIKFIDKKYNYCKSREYENPIPESDAYLLHYIGAKQKEEMLKINDFCSLQMLKEYLKGKSVAIVGNSEKILSQTHGEEIESHDIVIRFNKGYPSRKPEALGQRTDLLFLACTLSDYELKQFNAKYLIRRSKLCQNICDYKISTSDRTSLKQILAQASTGFIAINFALSANAKNIDLYGFDFFKSPTYYNEPNYQTLHNGNSEESKILEYQAAGLLKVC
jgi:Lipopolysaccharide biosynthesis proteins, LPS:glycosyltransferases